MTILGINQPDPIRELDQRIQEYRGELNRNPWFFLSWRVGHIQKQVAYFQQQKEKILAWADSHHQLTLAKERFETALKVERIHGQNAEELARVTALANIEAATALVEAQRHNQRLIQLAAEAGLSLVDFSALRKEQLMTPVLQQREQNTSNIKIEEHRQFKEIDFQYLTEETQLKLKAALAYRQITFEQVKYVLDRILGLVQERYELQFSGQPIRLIQEKQKYFDMVIQGWEVRLGRYLQSNNEEDIRGSDEDTQHRRLPEPDLAAGQE